MPEPVLAHWNVVASVAAQGRGDAARINKARNTRSAEAETQTHYVLTWHAEEDRQPQYGAKVYDRRRDEGAQASRVHAIHIRRQCNDNERQTREPCGRGANDDVEVVPIRQERQRHSATSA